MSGRQAVVTQPHRARDDGTSRERGGATHRGDSDLTHPGTRSGRDADPGCGRAAAGRRERETAGRRRTRRLHAGACSRKPHGCAGCRALHSDRGHAEGDGSGDADGAVSRDDRDGDPRNRWRSRAPASRAPASELPEIPELPVADVDVPSPAVDVPSANGVVDDAEAAVTETVVGQLPPLG